MNSRKLIVIAAWLLCLVMAAAVLVHCSRLAALQRSGRAPITSVTPELSEGAGQSSSDDEDSARELLQLRGEVTRLTARKRELEISAKSMASAAQPALNGASTLSKVPLPPGYVRRSAAQFVGYGSPENTLQSWLWALEHRDVDRFFGALSGAEAEKFHRQAQAGQEPQKIFDELGAIPGLAVGETRQLADGSVELDVCVVPNAPPEKVRLQLVGGEWKISKL